MARLLKLKTFSDSRGNLTVIENELPYPIKRVYYIYDVPKNIVRGGHSHKVTTQVLICTTGSCVVDCDINSSQKESFLLDSPDKALVLNPEDYHTMKDFTPGTTLLVLSSHPYDPSDYINESR